MITLFSLCLLGYLLKNSLLIVNNPFDHIVFAILKKTLPLVWLLSSDWTAIATSHTTYEFHLSKNIPHTGTTATYHQNIFFFLLLSPQAVYTCEFVKISTANQRTNETYDLTELRQSCQNFQPASSLMGELRGRAHPEIL